MNNIERLEISEDTYKGLYNEQKEKVEYLEGFISKSTVERIKELENKEKQLETLKVQLDEKDNTIKEIKEQADKRVKAIEYMKDRELEITKKSVLDKQRANINYTTVNPLKKELESSQAELERVKTELEKVKSDYIESETLLRSREEEIQRLKSIEDKVDTNGEKLDSIISKLDISFDSLFELLGETEADDKVVEAVDDIQDTINTGSKPTEEDKIAICKEIKTLKNLGKTNKQIAESLMKTNKWFIGIKSLNSAEQKVGRYIKSKHY